MNETYRYFFWVGGDIAYAGLTRDAERSERELREKFDKGGHIFVLRRPVDVTDGLKWERRQGRFGRPTRHTVGRDMRIRMR